MRIQLPWVCGDGGPTILIPCSRVPSWEGARDFERAQMKGGDLVTHYDLACRVREWIEPLDCAGMDGLVMGGDETAVAWCRLDAGAVCLIRPIYSGAWSASSEFPSAFVSGATLVDSRLFSFAREEHLLLMACDFAPSFAYDTAIIDGIGGPRMLDTLEYKDAENHLLCHVIR